MDVVARQWATPGDHVRLTGGTLLAMGAAMGIVIVLSTDQILPATSPYDAQYRVWLAARAAGFIAYVLLTAVVGLGLILSHPVNQASWRLSKRIFPWHENLLVFTVAFTLVHVVSIVLDPYAGVDLDGALIPGLSSYRNVPVALGTLSMYALFLTGISARYTKLLPPGMWLRLHRLSLGVWGLAWVHGILAGTDSGSLGSVYVVTGLAMVGAAAYRYWVARQVRRTFVSSLPEASGGPALPARTPAPAEPSRDAGMAAS
jgi:sulfoxide reductase heme-binding subunit YedZ